MEPRRLIIPVPEQGLLDGVDPASAIFPERAAAALENFRVGYGGVWQTRLGFTLQSGNLTPGEKQLLARYYRSAIGASPPTGDRWSIAAVAGTLYQRKHDAVAWTACTGAPAFGRATSPTFGVYAWAVLKDYIYLSDRFAGAADNSSGRLIRLGLSGTDILAENVAQPVTPASAPSLYRCMRGVLDEWLGTAGSEPTNWSVTDATNFTIKVAANTDEKFNYPITPANDPDGFESTSTYANQSADLFIAKIGSDGDDASRDGTPPTAVAVESNTLAFWASQKVRKKLCSFDVGGTEPGTYTGIIDPEEKDQPFMWFFGCPSTVNHRRFRVRRKNLDNDQHLFVGKIVRPGRLDGQYRWRTTFSDSGRTLESKPSAMTLDGKFEDFSHPQVSYTQKDPLALSKCAVLVPDLTGGSVSATPYVNLYRNGGVPSLIKDGFGQDVWVLVKKTAFIDPTATLVSALTGNSSTTLVVPTGKGAANLAAGDWLIIDPSGSQAYAVGAAGSPATPSTGGWEAVEVSSVAAGSPNDTITLKEAVRKSHSSGRVVATAFLDNVADAVLDSTQRLEIERDDPPRSAHWIVRLPDGRLALGRFREDRTSPASGTFGYERRLGVAISNLPTPYRKMDHEVFPNDVDPYTRRSQTQGFRFDITGDQAGDAIVWMGLFQRTLTILTQTALYQVFAYSQAQWGSTAVQKIADTGCIAGETVRAVDGRLFWVADGPRVMSWDGRSLPIDIGRLRVSTTLRAAPTANWEEWHATPYADDDGSWYKLAIVPSGGSDPTLILDYNLTADRWETTVYYDASAVAVPIRMFSYWSGPGDVKELYAVEAGSGNGRVMRLENGSTDNAQVIRVSAKSKRFPMGMIVSATDAYLRAAGVTDTLTLTVLAGGSEYGDVTAAYSISLAGSGDKEFKQRLAFGTLRGEWLQAQFGGSFSNRPAIRELEIWYLPVRFGRQGS